MAVHNLHIKTLLTKLLHPDRTQSKLTPQTNREKQLQSKMRKECFRFDLI
ncbi:hypothetical protein [Brunnivagina elsteri]|nr:hypothetical protein [Calothrix elsteri]